MGIVTNNDREHAVDHVDELHVTVKGVEFIAAAARGVDDRVDHFEVLLSARADEVLADTVAAELNRPALSRADDRR